MLADLTILFAAYVVFRVPDVWCRIGSGVYGKGLSKSTMVVSGSLLLLLAILVGVMTLYQGIDTAQLQKTVTP